MDINEVIEIIEALASGCSPVTGEVIDHDSVLNERDVTRALQIAVERLKNSQPETFPEVKIDKSEIKNAIELFKKENQNLTPNKLANFFHGTMDSKNENFSSNHLYGKYRKRYKKGQLLDFFDQYLSNNNLTNINNRNNSLYKKIDFFQKETFNRLPEKAIVQLKEKVDELGVRKIKNLANYIQHARINHPRAFEAWTDVETELLSKAIKYTNDLDLLSKCFQRGKGAIESCGQRLIYESQSSSERQRQN